MATFNDVGSGSITNFKDLLGAVTINTFNNLVRGMLFEMLSAHVNDFNLMNYDYMNLHMFRNAYEKEITLSTIGESAYRDGNADNTATPAQNPSYIGVNNYMEFVTNTRNGEKVGELTTRLQKAGEENTNYYLDFDNGDNQVSFTGSFLDRNSILYKTKKLMYQNKIKTIISKYHTEDVNYNGQVGSKYGESHGRNLLTKKAEAGNNDNSDEYGYDNPYCRVWTHQHKYDTIRKTMRANGGDMNSWDNFEWNETDQGHGEDNTQYGDGEKYDYAWKGKHNQDRREANSVLDTKTGLVKITPQYRGGGEANRHTKECMFSIENLAWKDYDPYSFEQALSWEQRGPLGGRIMWFPPYGLEVNETASARWQSNDFIGRGEPVYTYVNSERSGSLSFLMITDHPSSIDYASWWDDNNMIKNLTDNSSNSENDYLRYFAGCENDNTDGKTGGLIIKPTPLTDEYTRINPPLIHGDRVVTIESYPPPPEPPIEDKNPEYVEFFLFFPNNYSGVNDIPFDQTTSSVDAISYLLMGKNAQKNDDGTDLGMTMTNARLYEQFPEDFIGYEMSKGGITTDDCITTKNYIQGGKYFPKKEPKYKYEPKEERKWCYRIDHKQPYVGGKQDGTNLICEILKVDTNYKDSKTYKTNLDVANNERVKEMAQHKENVYSFAEVVAAIYTLKLQDEAENPVATALNKYLTDCGVNNDRVNKLVELFGNKDQFLTSVVCDGIASSHGHKEANELLSKNRANTLLRWIKDQTNLNKKNDIKYSIGNHQTKEVDDADKQNVNGESAKLYRCAHCVMTFESGTTQISEPVNNENNTSSEDAPSNLPEHNEYLGFKWVKYELQADGTMWNYYQKDDTIKYYDQVNQSIDNYDNPEKNDVVIDKDQILQIFRDLPPVRVQIIRNNPKYRGLYNIHGFYITIFDYEKNDDAGVVDFDYTQNKEYKFDDFVYDNGHLYIANKTFTTDVAGKTKAQIWEEYSENLDDNSNLMAKYAKDDYVLIRTNNDEEVFYRCLHDYIDTYPDFAFDANEWTQITNVNIEQKIISSYKYCLRSNPEFHVNDIVMDDEGVFMVCTKVGESPYPYYNDEYWDKLETEEFQSCEGAFYYELNDYVTHEDNLYICIDTTYYTDEFNSQNWELVRVYPFNPDSTDYYDPGTVVVQDEEYYKAKTKVYPVMCKCLWSLYLTYAIPSLIKETGNPLGHFDGDYMYGVGDCCYHNGDTDHPDNYYYYESRVDFLDKTVQDIPFDEALSSGTWEQAGDEEINIYDYSFELSYLVIKSAAVLCYTVDAMIEEITGKANVVFDDDTKYSCIWKYGTTNDLVTPDTITPSINLLSRAQEYEPASRPDSTVPNPKIRFSTDENNYLTALISQQVVSPTTTIENLRTYIILYRILDGVSKVNDTEGTRNVCEEAPESVEEMVEKTTRIDESETEGCKDSLWVDRGDRLLIQECNLPEDGETEKAKSRFNPETGEGDWNKLRYDQEYHFYKQWIQDHPLMYEKLQEKIKYFNPAFHSMTPEGFNARCTFLQQCTRQGNTKTMSDRGGKTANNLAFGRPPYCVLRLGDFYNQMIVIDNISFDYNVADGIQWDLNTEGNGVQPMLCKVNISFKFIGGGDITGPVQRLQNAMSFNYYANASFYDNRADRVEYQPTNWKTMGGAGNDDINLEKSYAFIAQNYEKLDKNVTTIGL